MIPSEQPQLSGCFLHSLEERRSDLKEVKTREHNNAPRVLSDAARAPKELAKRSIIQANE